jgi:hypothetical protein
MMQMKSRAARWSCLCWNWWPNHERWVCLHMTWVVVIQNYWIQYIAGRSKQYKSNRVPRERKWIQTLTCWLCCCEYAIHAVILLLNVQADFRAVN